MEPNVSQSSLEQRKTSKYSTRVKPQIHSLVNKYQNRCASRKAQIRRQEAYIAGITRWYNALAGLRSKCQ